MGYSNPVLKLPAVRRLVQRPRREREALAAVLRDLQHDANDRAEDSWRRSKAPMAAYWKAVGTYARHLAHALTRGASQADAEHPSDAVAPSVLDRMADTPTTCPFCGVADRLAEGPLDVGRTAIAQPVNCRSCGTAWTKTFTLTDANRGFQPQSRAS